MLSLFSLSLSLVINSFRLFFSIISFDVSESVFTLDHFDCVFRTVHTPTTGTNRTKMAQETKSNRPLPSHKKIDGITICDKFSDEAFLSALNYKPRADDIFVVTYPKCGTTWTQNIVSLILRRGKPFESALEFFTQTPFLEMTGAEAAEKLKRPAAIKLHLSFNKTPYSPEAKYIFVARNPKDCCVSFYYHTKNIEGYDFTDGHFDDYFELFMQGEVDFGDYFDCLLSWYEHRNDPNVLFITFEELKTHTKDVVLRIAGFLGQNYRDMMEQNPSILDDVLKYSSFSYMKEFFNRKIAELKKMPLDFIMNHHDLPQGLKYLMARTEFPADGQFPLMRSGLSGDWRSHFSEEQSARMDQKFKERTKGTDIPKLWEEYMKR